MTPLYQLFENEVSAVGAVGLGAFVESSIKLVGNGCAAVGTDVIVTDATEVVV
jgi:hypothetical protein